MKYIKIINSFFIILLFFLLIGCNNDYLSYKIKDEQLIIIIDDIEYNVGEIEYNNSDLEIKDAIKHYSIILLTRPRQIYSENQVDSTGVRKSYQNCTRNTYLIAKDDTMNVSSFCFIHLIKFSLDNLIIFIFDFL